MRRVAPFLPCCMSFHPAGSGYARPENRFADLWRVKAGRLPGLDAAEEYGKGQIEPAQGLFQGVAAKLHQLGAIGPDLRQDAMVVVVGDGLPGLAPGVDALFERRVVQLAVQPRARPSHRLRRDAHVPGSLLDVRRGQLSSSASLVTTH